MKESKLNTILNVTVKTLFGISALAFIGYVADSTYFHQLNLDFFPTGYASMFGTLIWGITAATLHKVDKIGRKTDLTFEKLDRRYQESLEYFRDLVWSNRK